MAGFDEHIRDSLALVPHLPDPLTRLIDLGSGQGFPAIPVAIASGIYIDLIEADRRKAAFLTTALATLGLEGRVTAARIETVPLTPAACVTARALAPLRELLTLARPLLCPGGTCLFLKGPTIDDEIADAARAHAFHFDILKTPSPRSNLVKITGLS